MAVLEVMAPLDPELPVVAWGVVVPGLVTWTIGPWGATRTMCASPRRRQCRRRRAAVKSPEPNPAELESILWGTCPPLER